MITSVTIDRLRGIKHGEVTGLTGLSILVGPNGCGKSTVLDALLIGGSSEPGVAVGSAVQRRSETPFGYDYLVSRGAKSAEVRIAGRTAYDTVSVAVRGARADIKIRNEAETGSSLLFSSEVTFDGTNAYVTDGRSFGDERVRLIETSSASPRAPLSQVWSMARKVERDTMANEVLGALVEGFERFELLANPDNSSVLNMVRANRPLPVSLAGEGILALVRTVLELANCADGGLALMEEPEVHQHPRTIRLMAQGICASVKRGVQVVLTTHSAELIDALLYFADRDGILDQTAVHLMRLRGGELVVSRLDGAAARFQTAEIGEDLR